MAFSCSCERCGAHPDAKTGNRSGPERPKTPQPDLVIMRVERSPVFLPSCVGESRSDGRIRAGVVRAQRVQPDPARREQRSVPVAQRRDDASGSPFFADFLWRSKESRCAAGRISRPAALNITTKSIAPHGHFAVGNCPITPRIHPQMCAMTLGAWRMCSESPSASMWFALRARMVCASGRKWSSSKRAWAR